MPDKWAYEMSDQELVEAFMNACARAGASNSGLVIDFSAPSDRAEAHYLKGVVLARLAGVKPLLRRGARVQVNQAHSGGVRSTNYDRESYSYHKIEPGSMHEITRVHYMDGKWELSFKGPELSYRFKAEDFELVPDEASKVA